ncbi:MAG: hypothetical protein Q9170_005270 [Blastenia crenularia]
MVSTRSFHNPSHVVKRSLIGDTSQAESRQKYHIISAHTNCRAELPLPLFLIRSVGGHSYTTKAEEQEKGQKEGENKTFTIPIKDYFEQRDSQPPDLWELVWQLHHVKVRLSKAQEAENVLKEKIEFTKSRRADVLVCVALGTIFYVCAMDKRVKDSDGRIIAALGPFQYLRCLLFLRGEKRFEECARAKVQSAEERKQEEKEELEKEKLRHKEQLERAELRRQEFTHRQHCYCGGRLDKPTSAHALSQRAPCVIQNET